LLPGVRESAVVGLPHPDFGEAVCAFLVMDRAAEADAARIIGQLKERIAGFKVPKRIWCVPELPRNAMGKVQKNVLREQYADAFQRAPGIEGNPRLSGPAAPATRKR
jgi:malonyl-CoA/methylmalonyl-CoA synthetase